MKEATECGFNFAYTKSEKMMSYFSTVKTMKEVGNLFSEKLPVIDGLFTVDQEYPSPI